jgi:mannose-6-phosphate isomerase-like protein (cupin superfamily)
VHLTNGKADLRYLIDSYRDWAAHQQVPVIEGLAADLDKIETAPWPQLGGSCRCAFIHLTGRGDFLALQLIEIPPGGRTDWLRHLYDEVFHVLSGYGGAVVDLGEHQAHAFEWGPRALFSPPLNARYRLSNLSASEPVRLLCANNLPFLMNVFRNEALLFDHPHAFGDRAGHPDAFSGRATEVSLAPGRHLLETSLIPDLAAVALPEWEARGAGNRNINIMLAESSMHARVSEMPPGTYTKGRWHDVGVHVTGVAGTGYTLIWKHGEKAFERLDLRPGSVFALPDESFHQHFNAGRGPLRYLAISMGNERYPMLARKLRRRQVFDRSVKDGGLQIDYADQDPRFHTMWLAELAKLGVASRMEQHFSSPALGSAAS